MEKLIVTTFYKFVHLKNPADIKLKLYKICKDNGILGTILLANEGMNGTMTGSREAIDQLCETIKSIPEFDGIVFKDSECDFMPFSKLKIKIKPEIIKFDETVTGEQPGKHLGPKEWEALIDSGAMVIDTRNDYEVAFGTFKNAVDPKTRNFTDLIEWAAENLKDHDKEAPIGMFCTGGVRCEKSTEWLKRKGFKNVYHLDGGIIQYFLTAENKNEYWQGDCFVFDDRVAIDTDLNPYSDRASS